MTVGVPRKAIFGMLPETLLGVSLETTLAIPNLQVVIIREILLLIPPLAVVE